MQYRKIANTDIQLSAVTFGAWAIGGWMWGGADKKQAIEGLRTAFDLGVSSFDTAPVYGFGQSEQLVGKALKDLQRDKIQILTKYGLRWDTSKGKFYFDSQDNEENPVKIHKFAGKESVIKECENSLRRLQTDYIDLYQIHWPDPTTPIEETMEAVEKLLDQGKIRAAGVCNYNSEQMKIAGKVVNIVSNQLHYSMVQRDIEKDIVPYCIENKKSILAYSPMQRGLLTGKITEDYEFSAGDHRSSRPEFQKENRRKVNEMLKKIEPIAYDRGITLPQLVLNWTLNRPGITCVLAGSRNPDQIKDNAKAGTFELTENEMKTIDNYVEMLNLQ